MKKRKADGTLKLLSRGIDRLSDLPDDVIGRILGFLPTPQAVRTSRLSRRWRRVWAHVRALNLSVRNCTNSGVGPAFPELSENALARFPTLGVPSISLEFDRHVYIAKANTWYAEAMERAVGSVRITVPCGVNRLALPLCTRAEAVELRLTYFVDLELPADPVPFGRLAELCLSTVLLPAGTPPLHEFLSSCCPRLRRLRLCCVRGEPVRQLVLRSDVLEALDLNNVDDLARVDVVTANLRSLSVRSCFRFPCSGGWEDADDTEVVVSAPRLEAICWYRSYPKRLSFLAGLTQVRRLSGLKLPTLGRSDQFDFPYTIQLLRDCSLITEYLDLEFILPDEMTLLKWLGPEGLCEDLMSYVPQLPRVSVLSLKIRWGFGGNIRPSLASFLSRVPSVTTLYIDSTPYCLTVLESAVPPQGAFQWGRVARTDEKLSLDSLREISVNGLKGTDSEECILIEVLLGAALPSLERISLAFHNTAMSVADEIATELQARFPMATGRWTKTACSSALEWTKRKVKSFGSN